MRFTRACALAASAATVTNAADAGIGTIFDFFGSSMIGDPSFYKGLLLNMQLDAGNVLTDCMSGYDDFLTLYDDLKTELATDVEYFAAIKDKGQGSGSSVGFYLSKGNKYLDLLASGVNVYNSCDVDYYMRAFSKATSNVSGFVNQSINVVFRVYNDGELFTNLETAFTSGDISLASKYMG